MTGFGDSFFRSVPLFLLPLGLPLFLEDFGGGANGGGGAGGDCGVVVVEAVAEFLVPSDDADWEVCRKL